MDPDRRQLFGRVSKERIIEAVREGVSVEAASNIAGTGWLPELLRNGATAGSSYANRAASSLRLGGQRSRHSQRCSK